MMQRRVVITIPQGYPALDAYLADETAVARLFHAELDAGAAEAVLGHLLARALNEPIVALWVGWQAPAYHHQAKRSLAAMPRGLVRHDTAVVHLGRSEIWFKSPDMLDRLPLRYVDTLVVSGADEVLAMPAVTASRIRTFGRVPGPEHWSARLRGSLHTISAADVLQTRPDADVALAVERDRAKLGPAAFARRWLGRLEVDAPRDGALDLVAWCARYLPHHMTSSVAEVHRELATDLAEMRVARGGRYCLVGTRGSAKSTLISLAEVLASICERTERYVMLISESAPQAELLLRPIREELEENEMIAADYPHAAGKGPVWRDDRIVTRNGVMVEAIGTGGSLRGRRYNQYRPTLIVVDDAEGDKHVDSPVRRAYTRRWMDRAVVKAGDANTNVLVTGNAIHRDCLTLNLQRRTTWKARTWKSIQAWPTNMDLWRQWETLLLAIAPDAEANARAFYAANKAAMDAGAVVVWPERESLYDLMVMRAMEGHTAFAAEKQCEPIDPESCEWPEAYFADHIWFDTWPRSLALKTIGLDPSKGRDARRGDYQAIVRLGRDKDQTLYVDASLERRDVHAVVWDFASACREWEPDAAAVETNQFQSLLADDILEAGLKLGCTIPIDEMDNTVPKVVRIRRLGPYLAQRRIRFRGDSPGARLLVEQLREFPVAGHDDGPDALEMALRAAIRCFNGRHANVAGGPQFPRHA